MEEIPLAKAPFTFGHTQMLFPTPILQYTLPEAARINAALLKEIEKRRETDTGVVRSNRAGWHSESDFFLRKEAGHAEASKAIIAAVSDATGRIRGKNSPPGTMQIQFNGWINVNPPLAYNVPHDHPGSFWSGCYYIKNDPPTEKNSESGAITFIDPRCAPAGQPLVKSPLYAGSFTVQPEPGTLLLFPSNAKHWVHPNGSEGDRVTMAFNVFLFSRPNKGEPDRSKVPSAD
jgi:uncharacterized protein (TIGR02466 family)